MGCASTADMWCRNESGSENARVPWDRHITDRATEDLKMGASKPEYAGKMNFYLSAIDDLLRHPDDKPTTPKSIC